MPEDTVVIGKIRPERMPIRKRTSASPAPRFTFYIGPFKFDSEIDLPELRGSAGSGELSSSIDLGSVPAPLSRAMHEEFCQVGPTEFLLNIPGTARYWVRNGNEVRIEIAPGAPIANVSTYLLGSIFGVLCHQNGLLPLHASAVESGGLVTAFLGESGAGKSTLAACLQRRGHRIVSDDICLLQPDSDSASEPLRVVPVANWLKLWNKTLQHLGETPVEQNRVFSTDDKFRVLLPNLPAGQLRLGQVVFLVGDSNSDAQPRLDAVPLLDAITGLMRMTYAGYVPELAGQKSRIFRQCAQAIGHAQACRLTVPWGLDRMDSVLDLLESKILFREAAAGGSRK